MVCLELCFWDSHVLGRPCVLGPFWDSHRSWGSLGQPPKLFWEGAVRDSNARHLRAASHRADRLCRVPANDFLKVPLGPDFCTLTLA